MRFIIYGPGAIGGVIGADLFRAGHPTLLIARGAHRDRIAAHGLTFVTPSAREVLRTPVVGHPDEIKFEPGDVVLLCMKSQDTAPALRELRAACRHEVGVICAQNGVANERMASRYFSNVYAMVVWLPGTHLEPGAVEVHTEPIYGVLDAGRHPLGTDARIEQVCQTLDSAHFSSLARADIMRWKHAKLLSNLFNGLQAISTEGIVCEPLRRKLRNEALASYAAAGIDCAGPEETRARFRLDVPSRSPRGGGSTWQSLQRGTGSIETDYLNGEVVLLGRLHGVPTPANAALQRLTADYAASGREPGSLPLVEVLEAVEREEASPPAGPGAA